MEKLSRIIEHVYSAALNPSRWPAAVRCMQRQFECAAAGFYVQDLRRNTLDLVHVNGVDSAYQRTYRDRYVQANPWNEPELQAPGKIRTEGTLDEHFKSPGFYRRTELFNEWMKPQDFIHTLGTNLAASGRERTKLFLYRPGRAGPFSRPDVERFVCLSGHLTTAVNVAGRLARQAAQTEQALDLLERVDLGVAFIDEDGHVIEANAFAHGLFAEADALRVEQGTVVAVRRDDAARLRLELKRALGVREGRSAEGPPGLKLRSRPGRPALQVRAVPLSRRSESPFCSRRAAVALVITDGERETAFPAEDLARLYGLTAAESRLVQWLLCGVSLRQAAELTHVKYETARWYLKNVFQKTGVTRQAELVRRLLTERPRLD